MGRSCDCIANIFKTACEGYPTSFLKLSSDHVESGLFPDPDIGQPVGVRCLAGRVGEHRTVGDVLRDGAVIVIEPFLSIVGEVPLEGPVVSAGSSACRAL